MDEYIQFIYALVFAFEVAIFEWFQTRKYILFILKCQHYLSGYKELLRYTDLYKEIEERFNQRQRIIQIIYKTNICLLNISKCTMILLAILVIYGAWGWHWYKILPQDFFVECRCLFSTDFVFHAACFWLGDIFSSEKTFLLITSFLLIQLVIILLSRFSVWLVARNIKIDSVVLEKFKQNIKNLSTNYNLDKTEDKNRFVKQNDSSEEATGHPAKKTMSQKSSNDNGRRFLRQRFCAHRRRLRH